MTNAPSLDEVYARGGETAVVREMLKFDNPDDDTFRWRWNVIFAALQKEHPEHAKSGFAE